jgi:hypothetical protein
MKRWLVVVLMFSIAKANTLRTPQMGFLTVTGDTGRLGQFIIMETR